MDVRHALHNRYAQLVWLHSSSSVGSPASVRWVTTPTEQTVQLAILLALRVLVQAAQTVQHAT